MQVERVLMADPEVGQNYVIVLERDGLKDTMKVQVESLSLIHIFWNTSSLRTPAR